MPDGSAQSSNSRLIACRLKPPSRSGGFSAYCSAMQPQCEDSDQTQTPEHTPAYHGSFGPNTDKLQHLVRFSRKAIENHTAQVNTLSTELAGLPAPQAA